MNDPARIRKTRASKSFTVPDFEKSLPTPKILPEMQTGELQKLMSVEEKQMFEMLFPVENTTTAARPLQAYSLRRNVQQDKNSGQAQNNTLGSRLDIRG